MRDGSFRDLDVHKMFNNIKSIQIIDNQNGIRFELIIEHKITKM